jgi:uncharacterized 2Fe-2S/4Fe-4S cluster protein (DUF4445 family)
MSDTHRIVFTPSGKRGDFAAGTSVLEAARSLGVDVDSVCGGRGICGRCQILVAEGDFAKHGISSSEQHLTDWNQVEERYANKRGALGPHRRLGCQAKLCGDVVIDVPPESQVHRQVVRKSADTRAIALEPVVRLHFVEVAEPDIDSPSSDFTRLCEALKAQWNIDAGMPDLAVLRDLQKTLRKGEWKVTVAVRKGHDIVGVFAGLVETAYGVAVDVGSTTIAAHLSDLYTGDTLASAGLMNPQIRFGEDLMSRVSYVMMNPGGENEMRDAVRAALDDLVGEVVKEANISRDHIVEMTVVGNPIMHHLFLGLDPTELGGAPFALTIDKGQDVKARDVGLHIAAGAYVYLLPCIAGHVGADTAGVVLSEAPHMNDDVTLLVDVGTNAEIVLGNKKRLLACSSPTGPAFEGAQLSSGQRAAPGAIERVRIDPVTLEPRFRIIGSELWSDDPNFAEEAAKTGVNGICGSGIIEAVAEMYLAGIITEDGVIDGDLQSRSHRILPEGRTFTYLLQDGEPRITITQADIRAIQLAKAALYAGVKLLLDHYGVEHVEKITLAGAFGSHIDVKYAMVLGLIPDCDLAKVGSAGNAAGTGARIALLNLKARDEIEKTVGKIEKIETAMEPKFQDHFVSAMAIPNKVDYFENLAKVVTFPPKKEIAQAQEGEGGRRRRRG